jgi:hypothetical protein
MLTIQVLHIGKIRSFVGERARARVGGGVLLTIRPPTDTGDRFSAGKIGKGVRLSIHFHLVPKI